MCQVAQCWVLETKQRTKQTWSLPMRGSQSREKSKADPKPGNCDDAGRWGLCQEKPQGAQGAQSSTQPSLGGETVAPLLTAECSALHMLGSRMSAD